MPVRYRVFFTSVCAVKLQFYENIYEKISMTGQVFRGKKHGSETSNVYLSDKNQ